MILDRYALNGYALTRHALTAVVFALILFALLLFPGRVQAQTASPSSIELGSTSAVCTGGQAMRPVSLTLPDQTTTDRVDVLLLFDDTGSFANSVAALSSQFQSLVGGLETTFPGVEFGFGVARFEDYGGPGTSFSNEYDDGRPFVLNQPIITRADAGGTAARNDLIAAALSRTAPGFGGDLPEAAVSEGLFQAATGAGFDGNGDGDTGDSGAAGETGTQTSPGASGDVPAFATNALPASGTLGGAGWREGAQKIVILATDQCSVASFDPDGGLPEAIVGTGGSEPVRAFACTEATAGTDRFGFVSDAKAAVDNTVEGATAPAGAATVQGAVDALNALGIQVVGIGPEAGPTASTEPSADESVFMSSIARLTGATGGNGDPLVVDLGGDLAGAITEAIERTTTAPIDITLATTERPEGLGFAFAPAVVEGVAPGGTAPFEATFLGDGSAVRGGFDIEFRNASSNAVLGAVPVTVDCMATNEEPTNEEPTNEEPTNEEPTNEEPTNEEPTNEEPTNEEPTNEEPTDEEPTDEEPTDEEPTDEEPTDDNPSDDNPSDDNPGDDNPGDDNPGDDNPGDDNPGDDNPGDDNPGDDNPGDDDSGDDDSGDDDSGDDDSGDFCARTPGYWKNHYPDAWPVTSLTLGGETYDGTELIEILDANGPGASERLATHLTATKLNLLSGSDPSIQSVVDEADAFLETHPLGSNPTGDAQDEANAIKDELDTYNNAEDCDSKAKSLHADAEQQPSASMPMAFGLESNYPNPSSGPTAIEFRVAEPGPVTIEVFDVMGRRVATLVDRAMAPGTYEVRWDGRSTSGRRLASGVYLYRMQAREYTATRRMTIVR